MPSLYINYLCHNMAHRGFHFLLFNDAIWGKYREEDVRLSGITLQSSSSKSLVVISHRQLINQMCSTMDSYCQTTQEIHKTLYKSKFDNYQQTDHSLNLRTAHYMESWSPSVVVIYVEKWCLAKVETLSQLPVCMIDTKERSAAKVTYATAP